MRCGAYLRFASILCICFRLGTFSSFCFRLDFHSVAVAVVCHRWILDAVRAVYFVWMFCMRVLSVACAVHNSHKQQLNHCLDLRGFDNPFRHAYAGRSAKACETRCSDDIMYRQKCRNEKEIMCVTIFVTIVFRLESYQVSTVTAIRNWASDTKNIHAQTGQNSCYFHRYCAKTKIGANER